MADTVKVVFAVYGALTDGWYDEGEQSVRRMTAMAGDVASTLQTLLNNTPNKVVTINNANMSPGGDAAVGDPAVGFVKHFAAIVEYNGVSRPYACQEGQTIDFSRQTARIQDQSPTADTVKVVYAVYGALDGNQVPRGQDVQKALQTQLNNTPNKVVTINNANMGGIRRTALRSISVRTWKSAKPNPSVRFISLVKRVRLSIFPKEKDQYWRRCRYRRHQGPCVREPTICRKVSGLGCPNRLPDAFTQR